MMLQTGNNKKKIFIADDDKEVLAVLREFLVQKGFDVDTIQDSKDIIHEIEMFNPDVILLDVRMPGIDGFDICEILNKDEKLCSIPLIIISGISAAADVKKAYKLGIVNYFTKPLNLDGLLEGIKKALVYKQEG